MDLHNFGSLIWALFILILVIQSIVRSARGAARSARVGQQVQPQAPPAPAPVPRRAPVRRTLVIPSGVSEATEVEVPTRAFAPPQPRPRSKAESIFGSGPLVARGIIALEVLGPPRALREWSSII